MKTVSQFISEALITFGKSAYPKFGNIVILAGGAGSGKGFQKNNLLGIEGTNVDVDAIKELATRAPKFIERVKREAGRDLSTFDMKKGEDVSRLHYILNDVYKIPDKRNDALFSSILTAHPDRKPNLIFDVTLKDISKLISIASAANDLGYSKQNIHIVWVVNDINVAMKQNKSRSRSVPEEILFATHQGAALTMKRILDMDDSLKQYMDGAIYISFNKIHSDVTSHRSAAGGSFIKTANYIQVKKQGQPQLSSAELSTAITAKIKAYVPLW